MAELCHLSYACEDALLLSAGARSKLLCHHMEHLPQLGDAQALSAAINSAGRLVPSAKPFAYECRLATASRGLHTTHIQRYPVHIMKTSNTVIAALLEFTDCLIHQLLHLRKLYSADLFEKQRLYGIAVHRSRHPELNDYISTVVESLQVTQLSS